MRAAAAVLGEEGGVVAGPVPAVERAVGQVGAAQAASRDGRGEAALGGGAGGRGRGGNWGTTGKGNFGSLCWPRFVRFCYV